MQHRFQHPQVAVALDLAKILLGDQERHSGFMVWLDPGHPRMEWLG